MSKMAPQIRFQGFTDDWEDRKLEDASEIIDGDRGKNYPSGDDFKNSGHTLFLSATNVTKQGFVFKENQYITNLKSELLGNGKVNLNDIILTSRGSIGHIGLYDERINENIPHARINSGMLILRTNKFNSPSFIAQFLKAPLGIKQIKLISFGSAQPQLTKKDIKKFKITLPKIEEQIKIGAFLKQLDDTIALHQCMLDLLKEQKKGFLQKMFPKNGAKVPELRFSGFADDWEERKVKEIFRVTRGQVLPATETSEKQSDISPFPVYSSQTKNNGLMGYYKDYLFDTAITWTTDGANAGTVNYRKGRFYSTNVNGVLISDKGYTNKAISEILNLEAWKWVSHVGNPKLMNNVMGDISITIPRSFREQDRLSEFFNHLDDTIALHQSMLDLLKEQKKGFLQKMFVS